jgi:hypothetical protein
MISEKALYWLAVGVMVMAGGNHFMKRLESGCLGQRTMAVVERISGGPAFAAILDNTSSQCARAQASVVKARVRMSAAQARFASMQARFASIQNRVAGRDVVCARLRAEKARLMALQQMNEMRLQMAAPSRSFRLEIPQISGPQVRISLSGDNL